MAEKKHATGFRNTEDQEIYYFKDEDAHTQLQLLLNKVSQIVSIEIDMDGNVYSVTE